MFAHSGPRLWLIGFAAGFAMLALPQAAGAAPPVYTPFASMVHIPAGSSHDNPRAPCTPGAEGSRTCS